MTKFEVWKRRQKKQNKPLQLCEFGKLLDKHVLRLRWKMIFGEDALKKG